MSAIAIRPRASALIGSVVLPVVLGSLACAAIAALVRAVATIPPGYEPFAASGYVPLTALGVCAGAVGWLVVRRRASNPAAVLRVLVPAIVLLSLVPDVLLGVTNWMSGTSWPAVVGLMAMHLAVAAVSVGSFARLLPPPRTAKGGTRMKGTGPQPA